MVLARVTISGKAKIGTMDGHFSRDQINGVIIFFRKKRDAQIQLQTWFLRDGTSFSKEEKKIRVDLQKIKNKKKRSSPVWLPVLCHLRPINDTKRAST